MGDSDKSIEHGLLIDLNCATQPNEVEVLQSGALMINLPSVVFAILQLDDVNAHWQWHLQIRKAFVLEAVRQFERQLAEFMDLILNDDQRHIREEAVRFLADKSSSDCVRKTVEAGTGFDGALWEKIAGELGWCAMAIPEEYDGLGLGLTELVLLMEAMGERLAPVPLWSTACVAAPLIQEIAHEEAKRKFLPRIAAGEIAATVAWGDVGSIDPLKSAIVSASRDGDGYILDGQVAQVVHASADLVLVPAQLGGKWALFALEHNAGHQVRVLATLDGTRQIGEFTLSALKLPADCRIDAQEFDGDDIGQTMAIAHLCLAAEQVGAARGVMDLTLAYIAERVQFGRVIASFQAIKHRCARLEVAMAEARALVYGAAANFASSGALERSMEVSGARAFASNLLFQAAEESIQLHGGVGFTTEYDPHLYFKRAQTTASLLGAADQHFDRIAKSVLNGEAEQ